MLRYLNSKVLGQILHWDVALYFLGSWFIAAADMVQCLLLSAGVCNTAPTLSSFLSMLRGHNLSDY